MSLKRLCFGIATATIVATSVGCARNDSESATMDYGYGNQDSGSDPSAPERRNATIYNATGSELTLIDNQNQEVKLAPGKNTIEKSHLFYDPNSDRVSVTIEKRVAAAPAAATLADDPNKISVRCGGGGGDKPGTTDNAAGNKREGALQVKADPFKSMDVDVKNWGIEITKKITNGQETLEARQNAGGGGGGGGKKSASFADEALNRQAQVGNFGQQSQQGQQGQQNQGFPQGQDQFQNFDQQQFAGQSFEQPVSEAQGF